MVRELTNDEIVRWLRRLRYDDVYRKGDKRVPINCVATLMDTSRQTIYQIMLRRYATISPQLRQKMSLAFFLVERGLFFRRVRREWVAIMPEGVLLPGSLVTGEINGDENVGVPKPALPAGL